MGLAAERLFGFRGEVGGLLGTAQAAANARALGSALLVILCVPWTLCLLAFSGLHWTFSRDAAAAVRTARRNESVLGLVVLVDDAEKPGAGGPSAPRRRPGFRA